MREVTTAKSAGFCFGVKRAVDMVYDEAKKGERVYTLGPIIHNQQVVEDLEKKGVKVIDSVNDINNGYDATVIIRSHGVPEKVIKALIEKNVKIVASQKMPARHFYSLRHHIFFYIKFLVFCFLAPDGN